MARVDLTDIAGIGPAAAAELRRAGIADAESLAQAPASALEAIRGFGSVRSAAVQSAARALLAAIRPPKAAKKKDKKVRKDKRKKRDKKKRDKGKKRDRKGAKDKKRKKRDKKKNQKGKKDDKGKRGGKGKKSKKDKK